MGPEPTDEGNMSVRDPGVEPPQPSEAQLHAVVDQHAPAVYRVALSIVGDPALADDVVQETLFKAWRKAPIDDDGHIPKAWLLRVARNTAISLLRTRREDLYSPEAMPDSGDGVEIPRTVEGRAQVEDLWLAFRHLDADARALLVLKEVNGLSYDEIAMTLELPLPTVKTRLFRARNQLKDALREWR